MLGIAKDLIRGRLENRATQARALSVDTQR